jgi:hypothetical protein
MNKDLLLRFSLDSAWRRKVLPTAVKDWELKEVAAFHIIGSL